MTRKSLPRAAWLALVSLLLGACGGTDGTRPAEGAASGTAADRPTIVVTTSVLGDVVANLVGDLARVETIMPRGASPHDFQPSARQIAALRQADALVTNGAGFESGMLDTLEAAAADGVPAFEAITAVRTLPRAGRGDHDGHDHEGDVDPHFTSDPSRVRHAAAGVVEFLAAEVPGIDEAALRERASAYLDQLGRLDEEVEAILAPVPAARRRLVTNHEVLGYFADRYGFEVLGAVVPGGGTQAEPSAGDLTALARTLREAQVAAVFTDTSSPSRLAEALAAEVPGVQVVELWSEALGPEGSDGGTYLDLARTNAQRIADALRP